MGTISIWHAIMLLVMVLTLTVPFIKIFPRAGLPAWLGIFGIVPLVSIIFLWLLAFKRWPGDTEKT